MAEMYLSNLSKSSHEKKFIFICNLLKNCTLTKRIPNGGGGLSLIERVIIFIIIVKLINVNRPF